MEKYKRPQIEIHGLEVELLTLSEDGHPTICNFKKGIMKKIKEKIADALFFAYAVFIVLAVWVIELICKNSILENE